LDSISMVNMLGNVDNACVTSKLRWMARTAADVRQCTKLGVNGALAFWVYQYDLYRQCAGIDDARPSHTVCIKSGVLAE
jgi:hypothetical protein